MTSDISTCINRESNSALGHEEPKECACTRSTYLESKQARRIDIVQRIVADISIKVASISRAVPAGLQVVP